MADVSKLNGYDIKDAVARANIDSLEAQDIYFDNDIRGVLQVTDVQSAIDELTDRSTSASAQITNKADKTALALTDKKLQYLSDLTKGKVWTEEAGTTPAYQHTVTSGAKAVAINGIGGKTIVYNQLMPISSVSTSTENGITYTNNADGSWTINGTSTTSQRISKVIVAVSSGMIAGHKYYLAGSPQSTLSVAMYGLGYSVYGGSIFTYVENANKNIRLDSSSAGIYTFDNVTIKPILIDLTKMFGSGNEPTTVAQFKAMFPDDYYAYNAGELVSADVTEVDSVGINLWDEQWESGLYNVTTGAKTVNANYIRSTNLIPINPNATYYFKRNTSEAYFVYFDYNKNYLSHASFSPNTSSTVTTPNNAYYIGLDLKNTSYNNDTSINRISTDTSYHKAIHNALSIPQVGTHAAFSVLCPMRSAGSVYDEIDVENKKYIQRIGTVDLGTLSWSYMSSARAFTGAIAEMKNNAYTSLNLITPKYTTQAFTTSDSADKVVRYYGYDHKIMIRDTSYTDVTEFKSAVNGTYIYYELEASTETDISSYFTDDNLLTVEANGTLTFVQSDTSKNIYVPNDTVYAVQLSEYGGNS